jgi:hypothetical protein
MATDERQHGTRAEYLSGCRCELCKLSNSQYMRVYRQGQRGTYDHRLPPLPVVASRPIEK